VEEAGALAGEALGRGGCDAHWRGHAGWRRQGRWWERRWEEAEALTDGGAAQGVAGSDARRWGRRGAEEVGEAGGVRSGDAGLGGMGSVGRRGVARRGVGRAAWGRAGGAGRSGRANTRGVGRLSVWGSVDRLDRWVQMMDLWSITLGDE
jgi:hypothetical protein